LTGFKQPYESRRVDEVDSFYAERSEYNDWRPRWPVKWRYSDKVSGRRDSTRVGPASRRGGKRPRLPFENPSSSPTALDAISRSGEPSQTTIADDLPRSDLALKYGTLSGSA
jgi:hypothetical protein